MRPVIHNRDLVKMRQKDVYKSLVVGMDEVIIAVFFAFEGDEKAMR